jgi:xylulose-5-phosphate/fructose-6-phosphate phosphoketolase
VFCIVGDGEAETGPLAASWHSNKFIDPAQDGAVVPILHLNGYKIANPTVLARIPETQLLELMRGYGHAPVVVSGDDPAKVHQQMAAAMDWALDEIARIKRDKPDHPGWPMIVLRTPKGWTGPKEVDGKQVEGTWRAHQVPVEGFKEHPDHLRILDEWMRGYRPDELFDAQGTVRAEVTKLAPKGSRRMSANPHANGGELLKDLRLPDFRDYAVDVERPGTGSTEATRVMGRFLRDVVKLNPNNFRIMGPDETN